jgi:hypothetical protein
MSLTAPERETIIRLNDEDELAPDERHRCGHAEDASFGRQAGRERNAARTWEVHQVRNGREARAQETRPVLQGLDLPPLDAAGEGSGARRAGRCWRGDPSCNRGNRREDEDACGTSAEHSAKAVAVACNSAVAGCHEESHNRRPPASGRPRWRGGVSASKSCGFEANNPSREKPRGRRSTRSPGLLAVEVVTGA